MFDVESKKQTLLSQATASIFAFARRCELGEAAAVELPQHGAVDISRLFIPAAEGEHVQPLVTIQVANVRGCTGLPGYARSI